MNTVSAGKWKNTEVMREYGQKQEPGDLEWLTERKRKGLDILRPG